MSRRQPEPRPAGHFGAVDAPASVSRVPVVALPRRIGWEPDDLPIFVGGGEPAAVERGDFQPPRSRDPSIDRALDGVCKKAMALNPVDRYATPKALAEDAVRRSPIDSVVFAPSIVYTPGDHWLRLLERLSWLPAMPTSSNAAAILSARR